MKRFWVRLLRETQGQDFVEYALATAFIAVSCGAVFPGVTSSISTVMSKVTSIMSAS